MTELIIPDKKLLGPCFGIQRALDECLRIKNKKKYLMYGQIGHNKALCRILKKEGIDFINDLGKIKNKKIIIRAHGIAKKDRSFLDKKNIDFLDLTCPFVKNFLKKALTFEKKNYQIVIIGRKNHIEIKNIKSFLKNPLILDKKREIKNIPFCEKIACFSQTTQTLETIKTLLPLIKRRAKNFIYIETRCFETQIRQDLTKKIAKKVDLMIVAGDNNSENTKNLLKISKKTTASIIISDKKFLNKKIVEKVERIGVIVGASTPVKSTEEIINFIKKYGNKKINKRSVERI